MARSTRRHFLRRSAALAGVGLLAGCGVLPSPTQQTAKVPRVGWLSPGSAASDEHFLASFRDGLGELGWAEGRLSIGQMRNSLVDREHD